MSSKQSQEVFVLMLSFFLHINVCLIWERIAEQTNFMQNFSKKNLTWLKLDDRTPEFCEIIKAIKLHVMMYLKIILLKIKPY